MNKFDNFEFSLSERKFGPPFSNNLNDNNFFMKSIFIQVNSRLNEIIFMYIMKWFYCDIYLHTGEFNFNKNTCSHQNLAEKIKNNLKVLKKDNQSRRNNSIFLFLTMIKSVLLKLKSMTHNNKMTKLFYAKNYKDVVHQVVWVQLTTNPAGMRIFIFRNSIDLLMGSKKISLSNLIE